MPVVDSPSSRATSALSHAFLRACSWLTFTVLACAAPSNAPERLGRGALVLDSVTLDLGAMDLHEAKTATLRLTNQAKVPVRLDHVGTSRFCSGAIRTKQLEPSARGEVRVTCKSDVPGQIREQLSLYAVDSHLPAVVFHVLGSVVSPLAFEFPSVHAQMPYGESRRMEVALIGRLADAASLHVVPNPDTAADATQDIETTVVPKGIVLRFDAKKVGTTTGQFLFTTGVPAPAWLALPWSRTVRGSIQVTPSNPYFNLKLPGAKQAVLEITSTQPGFRVVAARVIRGPFDAWLEPSGVSSVQRIRVQVREERCAEDATGIQGMLLVVSNDRSEPEKHIPLFGLGRLASP